MTQALAAELAGHAIGQVWSAEADDRPDYDRERSGFNVALDHRPALVLAAATEDDVAQGIRFATDHDLAVDLQATGHGAHHAMNGGLLITTHRLTDVQIDAEHRVARVAAGATAADVLAATVPHGLAAPVGAAPGVGFLAYTLGGGLGLLGRRYGYAADHVCRLDVVTADGRELAIDPNSHPDLFWALRGGGGNFAAVTALHVGLVPVSELFGGGLFFPGEQASDVFDRFAQCIAGAPDELSLSAAFISFPDLPVLPPPLRGRFVCHVRVGYLGDADAGSRLIAPLRAAEPFLDTVQMIAMTEVGSIHADPTQPMPVHTNSAALTSDDALADLVPYLRPDTPFVLEVRHLGGALTHEPEIANSVGHRAAQLNLFTSAYPGTDVAAAARAQQQVYDATARVSIGGPIRNFLPSQFADATSCYELDTLARLADIKATSDPGNLFRYAPSLTADVSGSRPA